MAALFAGLPDELWVRLVLPQVGPYGLVRLQRTSRAGHRLVGEAPFARAIADERAARDQAKLQDRERRQGSRFPKPYMKQNPLIVRLALEGDWGGVRDAIKRGAKVDACGRWEETDIGMSGFEKSWSWNNDTALTMACSQGNTRLAHYLVNRGANPQHRVCNTDDVHYTAAQIARQHGHVMCADYMDRVIRKLDAAREAAEQQRRCATAVTTRAEARGVRDAGPPYLATAGGTKPQHLFAEAALDLKHGLGTLKAMCVQMLEPAGALSVVARNGAHRRVRVAGALSVVARNGAHRRAVCAWPVRLV